jgi:hypothetical protein
MTLGMAFLRKLPKVRCEVVGVPEEAQEFRTKGEIAPRGGDTPEAGRLPLFVHWL